MLASLLQRVGLVAGFSLTLGSVGWAGTLEFASQVSDLKAIELSNLPAGKAQPQENDAWRCSLTAEEIQTAAGKLVSSSGWLVTSEEDLAGLTFVSFVERAEPGTSGTCDSTDGNVGVFRGNELLGLIYANQAADWNIGSIQVLSDDSLRIWSGDWIGTPLADIRIVGRDLLIVKNVADRDSFCGGAVSVPNIFGLEIHQARQVLMAEGWAPFQELPEESFGFENRLRDRVPELESCLPTGLGYCSFGYRKGDTQTLGVTTAGDGNVDGTPSVISYGANCEVESGL